MKEKKISLDAHGMPIDHSIPVQNIMVIDDGMDEWAQNHDDDFDFTSVETDYGDGSEAHAEGDAADLLSSEG